PVNGGAIRLPDTPDLCLRYEVSLDSPLRRGHGGWRTDVPLKDTLVSPSVWLWQPPLNDATTLRVTFDLPEAMRVSVPWQPLEDAEGSRPQFEFGTSPRSSRALSAFGEFDYREVAVPGSVLRVSLLRGALPMDNDAIVRWLKAAATDVTLAYGRFPNPSPQIVVVPVGKRSEAVPFGRVIRDGGEAVQFFIDETRPIKEFLDDWTATHEFSHLLFPYVGDRWVSEGFATYYQNVLLARAGVYSERRAWQKLHEGFERGRRSSPGTSPNAASMRNGGVMKIYWSGAAVALMGDVALRRHSDGAESLDTVIEKLQACCLPSAEAWTAMELFERLDELADTPVFVDLYDRYADAPDFPSVDAVYRLLGISIGRGDRVRLTTSGEGAVLRRAMMALSPDVAAARGTD
ncbi:MAG: hypothetical protein AAGD86_13210, partial [Pseudomonadota bacterium]